MDKKIKIFTFIVTKDCQLACKYCYLVGKNNNERMSWDIAKRVVDYILTHRDEFPEDEVYWDFIGGEPFLEIELIDRICDYIKLQMYKLRHPWFDWYTFGFTTNGINYNSAKVQEFIRKNKKHMSVCITIDGTKEKHDLNRIWKNSMEGSYKDVVKNIPLWMSQFPMMSTKVTISSEDIKYIKDSVLHIFSLGIHKVNMNVVYEDVWKEGDDILFEEQMIALADIMIDKGYYREYSCSMFNKSIGKLNFEDNNWCGAGQMMSIDAAGNFYPCTRFAQYSLRNKKALVIGDVNNGIDHNRLRAFLTLDRKTQSDEKCLKCEISTGCGWCQGENYDAAETSTIFKRSIAICKMHKARVRANNYYWNKLKNKIRVEGTQNSIFDENFEFNNFNC